MNQEAQLTLSKAAQAIFDKKGVNIYAVDLTLTSAWTNYCLIAEGTIDRHVVALADAVKQVMKKEGVSPFYTEGENNGDWVVIDYGEFVVHILIPELREKYHLEELWKEGNVIDLSIDTSKDVGL